MERIALVATLKPDSYRRAEELAADAGVAAADTPGLTRLSIFLAPTEVVFVLEGNDLDRHVAAWFDDPARSTTISAWLAIFDGPLHRAPQVAAWEFEEP